MQEIITEPFEMTFRIPMTRVGIGMSGTIYLRTRITIEPATPPAKNANPKNSTTLACQSASLSPVPLPAPNENDSEESLNLSTVFIISIPNDDTKNGIQSVNVTWTLNPGNDPSPSPGSLFVRREYKAESRIAKNASA